MTRSQLAFEIDENVSVSLSGRLSNENEIDRNSRINKNGAGALCLNTTNMLQTGLGLNSGLVVLRAPQSRQASVSPIAFGDGTIELDGHDLLGYEFSFGNDFGADRSGSIRNSNRERESCVMGDIPWLSSWDNQVQQFGGAGDIRYIGNINEPDVENRRLFKTGPGKLTFIGASTYEGAVGVDNGMLVLDYAVTNASKIGNSALVHLRGGLGLIGSDEGDTVETIGALRIGYVAYGGYAAGQVQISAQGRNNFAAELRVDSLEHDSLSGWSQTPYAVNFTTDANSAIKVLNAANYPGAGIINPSMTFNGASFARYSTQDDGNGYHLIEPLPDNEYAADFDSGTDFEIVDVMGAIINESRTVGVEGDEGDWWQDFVEKAVALRFNNPGASLTVNGRVDLEGRPGAAAILVTPNSGNDPILIDGTGTLFHHWNSSFFIHQYNTNAPIVVKARIFREGAGNALVKTGSGELVLTEAKNLFGELIILTGAVTTDELKNWQNDDGNGEQFTASGWSNITLGNGATLNYTGPQTATDRAIYLGGNATIASSGAGPVAFTRATTVTTQFGNANILTLAGESDGEISGWLDLKAGGIVKTGAGAWTLSGIGITNKFFCGAEIEAGKLVVDCALGNDVKVKANGTLAGSGFITRDLKLSGALEFNPDNGALTVGRDIIIDGAELSIDGRLTKGEFVSILNANGKVVGEFANVPSRYKLRYTANSVEVQDKILETMIIIK